MTFHPRPGTRMPTAHDLIQAVFPPKEDYDTESFLAPLKLTVAALVTGRCVSTACLGR